MIFKSTRGCGFILAAGFTATLFCSSNHGADLTTAPTSTADATAQGATNEAKSSELFKLKNEDLIKQAQTLFDKFNSDYLAQQRDLAAAEMLVADARKQLADLKAPAASAAAETASPKAAVEAAKAKKE